VIVWGYYGVLARIIVPAMESALAEPERVGTLTAVERRALPLMLLSVALFGITGTYLLVADPAYAGIGNIFASTWTALMLAKHLVVIVMVIVGVVIDWLIRTLPDPVEFVDRVPRELRRIRLLADGATGLGAVIALLTVAAQAS
jgi:uncharacterized membrane protein